MAGITQYLAILNSVARSFLAGSDSNGNLSPAHTLVDQNGVPVSTGAPLPVSDAALTTANGYLSTLAGTVAAGEVAVSGTVALSGSLPDTANGALAGNALYADEALRTFIVGYTNPSNIFGVDLSPTYAIPTSLLYGGQMFTASDATAKVDCIVQGAGTIAHPLTGTNSLVTTVSGFTNFQSVTLASPNSQASLSGSSTNIFVGNISVKPTYNLPLAVGSDAGTSPVLTVRKSGTHVRVGYLMGGASLTDIRIAIQQNEQIIWEGEVECYGGPFIPKIYAGASSTVQVLYLQIDDRDGNLRQPLMTTRQAFGSRDPTYSALPFGGDTGHPSQLFLANVVDEVTATQNLATPTVFGNNFGANAPTTGFSYTIPSNQAFTELNPAGTLATGTVTLPAVFPQGGRLEVFSTQTITALTVSAPGGQSIVGAAATTLAANGTIAYRLNGTTWCRVQ